MTNHSDYGASKESASSLNTRATSPTLHLYF